MDAANIETRETSRGFLVWLVIIASGVGGVIGIGVIAWLLMENNSLFALIMIPFMLLYGFGVYTGVQLFRDVSARNLRLARRFWLVQIPTFSVPWFSYYFGAGVLLLLQWFPPAGFNLFWFIGSNFNMDFRFGGAEPLQWMFGINVVALLIWKALGRRMEAIEKEDDASRVTG